MRKIIFTLFILLSFSFACDNPYEQIGDYKIGCPAEISRHEFQLIGNERIGGKKALFYAKENTANNLFKGEVIMVIDGNVELVMFLLKDGIPAGLLQSLIERWGEPEPDSSMLMGLLGLSGDVAVITPKNSAVSGVFISPEFIAYGTKRLDELAMNDGMQEDYSRY